MNDEKPPQVIIYETADGIAKVSVRLEDETVWLTQQQLADLYGTSRPNVTMHIRNIFSDGELAEAAVCKKFLQTAADGKNYSELRKALSLPNGLCAEINLSANHICASIRTILEIFSLPPSSCTLFLSQDRNA